MKDSLGQKLEPGDKITYTTWRDKRKVILYAEIIAIYVDEIQVKTTYYDNNFGQSFKYKTRLRNMKHVLLMERYDAR